MNAKTTFTLVVDAARSEPQTVTVEEKPPEEKPAQAGGDPPKFDDVSVDLAPDDGLDHHAHSIQVATDAKLKLSWKTSGAVGSAGARAGRDPPDPELPLTPSTDARLRFAGA